MEPRERATLVAGRGLVDNANQGGPRQVTILAIEAWERVTRTLAPGLSPAVRRANLVVSGVDLASARGRVVTIGRCRIRVHGETRPCEQMDRAVPGLRARLVEPWTGGVFGEALDAGEIAVGDAVAVDREGTA